MSRPRWPDSHNPPSQIPGTVHIVRSLTARGVPVRVLTRRASRARGRLADAAEIVEGDLESRAALAKALQGVACVVVSVSAFSREQIRRMIAIERDAVIAALDEARRAGIRRFVYVSVFDIREEEMPKRLPLLDLATIKQDVERYLKASGLDWTVIGAPPSMEVFFAMTRGDRMIVPGGGWALAETRAVSNQWLHPTAVLPGESGG